VSELEGMINGILSNPEEMKKIMEMAGKIMGSESGNSSAMPADNGTPVTQPGDNTLPEIDIGSLAAAAQSFLSSDTVKKLLASPIVRNIIGEAMHPNNDKKELFNALKPWISEERRHKLDKAIVFARVMRVAGAATLIKGG